MAYISDPRLTVPYAPAVAAAIAQSYGGMAHFAGTGPEGRTCRECAGWCRAAQKFARDRIQDGGGAPSASVWSVPPTDGRSGRCRCPARRGGLPPLRRSCISATRRRPDNLAAGERRRRVVAALFAAADTLDRLVASVPMEGAP